MRETWPRSVLFVVPFGLLLVAGCGSGGGNGLDVRNARLGEQAGSLVKSDGQDNVVLALEVRGFSDSVWQRLDSLFVLADTTRVRFAARVVYSTADSGPQANRAAYFLVPRGATKFALQVENGTPMPLRVSSRIRADVELSQ